MQAAEEGGKSLFERWFLSNSSDDREDEKNELVESANAKLFSLRWLLNNFKVKAWQEYTWTFATTRA